MVTRLLVVLMLVIGGIVYCPYYSTRRISVGGAKTRLARPTAVEKDARERHVDLQGVLSRERGRVEALGKAAETHPRLKRRYEQDKSRYEENVANEKHQWTNDLKATRPPVVATRFGGRAVAKARAIRALTPKVSSVAPEI